MVASGVQRVGGHINQHFGAVALVLVIGGLVAAAHVLVSAQLRALVRDLRKAIEDDQLRMEYQPLAQLRTGHVRAVEALLRWDHPSRGPVPPGD